MPHGTNLENLHQTPDTLNSLKTTRKPPPIAKLPTATAQAEATTEKTAAVAYTVGSYLAARLAQIGLKHHFVVAGDYTLVLLDQLLTNKDMQQV